MKVNKFTRIDFVRPPYSHKPYKDYPFWAAYIVSEDGPTYVGTYDYPTLTLYAATLQADKTIVIKAYARETQTTRGKAGKYRIVYFAPGYDNYEPKTRYIHLKDAVRRVSHSKYYSPDDAFIGIVDVDTDEVVRVISCKEEPTNEY